MSARDPLFIVQAYGKGWKEMGKFFLWDEAVREAKKLSRRKYSDGRGTVPSRIRFRRKTLSWFQGGANVSPKLRTLAVWPDGSREWQ